MCRCSKTYSFQDRWYVFLNLLRIQSIFRDSHYFSFSRCAVLGVTLGLGVEKVETNVEAKTVVVEAAPSVTPQEMLEKLQKVRTYCTFFL